MKNHILRFLSFSTAIVAAAACASPATVTEPVVYSRADAADSVRIRVGQTIIVDDVRIKLSAVESDSRCGTDVVCVWQGDATTLFLVSPNSESASQLDQVRLHTGVEPRAGTAQHYRVELLAVTPAPRSTTTIKQEDYAAWIRVVRME